MTEVQREQKTQEQGSIKVQFDISADRAKDIEDLIALTGCSTRKELFNNALSILEWAVKEVYMGNVIASIDEKNKKVKELVMPALSNVAKSKR
jgi:hypothetical protein